jgi:hypothetical protein
MPRDKATIVSLLNDFKVWYANDLNVPYSKDDLVVILKDEVLKRKREFIKRRLGHLPDADLIAFLEEAMVDTEANPKPKDASTSPPSSKPVIAPTKQIVKDKRG